MGAAASRSAVWSTIAFDVALNAVGFAYSAYYQTEHYFDMVGTSSFINCSVFALVGTLLRNPGVALHSRQIFLLVTTSLWAGRLFQFLTTRVKRLGGDGRFDAIKTKPARFAVYWIIQSIWIAAVGLPTFEVLSMEPATVAPWIVWDSLGAAVWAVGFAFETAADVQKSAWQNKLGAARKDKFISHGVWSLCRYPNYFGEITLWMGSYMVAANAVPNSYAVKYLFAISPLLTTLLLTRVSGIPIQEKQAKKRFAGNEEYARYVATTSTIVPWFKIKPRDKTA
ncbi:hypothetical protein DFJ73DRAFT_808779 [Zopfochytrium polystomum]|nr:hypothetical protein DFJ73DRAFT_808779 [Zopfochytrium polystomum]